MWYLLRSLSLRLSSDILTSTVFFRWWGNCKLFVTVQCKTQTSSCIHPIWASANSHRRQRQLLGPATIENWTCLETPCLLDTGRTNSAVRVCCSHNWQAQGTKLRPLGLQTLCRPSALPLPQDYTRHTKARSSYHGCQTQVGNFSSCLSELWVLLSQESSWHFKPEMWWKTSLFPIISSSCEATAELFT